VAYYRHSARDRQENSVAIQQELVRKWAQENGVDIRVTRNGSCTVRANDGQPRWSWLPFAQGLTVANG